MFSRIKRPSAPMVISVAALVVALGGTSYAAAKIDGSDIAKGTVASKQIKDGSIKVRDLSNGARATDGKDGVDGMTGADGMDGQDGKDGRNGIDGATGPAGIDGVDGTTISRWALVEADGTISAQSGGFTVVSAYDFANTPTPAPPAAAQGNVYIDTGEDLSNNGVIATIALQNTVDQDGDSVMTGALTTADSNPEFSGEITVSRCNEAPPAPPLGPTNCAPALAKNVRSIAVSPRNSDGSKTVTTPTNTHKRFYIVLTGDSTDYVSIVS